MKTRNNLLYCFGLSIALCSGVASAHPRADAVCGDAPHPLLSVADFDGNGIVDRKDVAAVKRRISKEKPHEEENDEEGKLHEEDKPHKDKPYYALYDRNADGKLDRQDVTAAIADLGKLSTAFDRQIAKLYAETKSIQTMTKNDLIANGFVQIMTSLQGHGEHWDNQGNAYPSIGGVTFSTETGKTVGAYVRHDAVPLFFDGTAAGGMSPLDFPTVPGQWMNYRVQAYAGEPPSYFGGTYPYEIWHTHAGMCITQWDYGNGVEGRLDQHTSFLECQALPSVFKTVVDGVEFNPWFNIFMEHFWLFNLNPAGFTANLHPCVDQSSPDESVTNGGREVPPYFMNHMGGGGH